MRPVTSTDAPEVESARGTPHLAGARSRFVRLGTQLFEPVDATWLAAFRVLFGAIVAVSMHRFLSHGWVDSLLVDPPFHFGFWPLPPLPPLSRTAMHALFRVLSLLGVCFSLGLAYRIVAPLLTLGVIYVQLIDVATYLNHYYLVGLLLILLTLSPAHREWSVDAVLFRRFRATPPGSVPRLWLWLFRFQVGLVYFSASCAKLQSDWLLHGQPLGIWLGMSTDLPLLGPLFALSGVPLVLSWCGFLFDLTIVLWLSIRQTRPWAYLVVLVFHTLTHLLFDIGMFPFIMSAAALVFFPPDWPRRLLGRAPTSSIAAPPFAASPAAMRRALVAFSAFWLAVQVALPLRALVLYPSGVLWHEQGMRFSWRVMVRAKGGSVRFIVVDRTTQAKSEVEAETYLTAHQENEFAGQPDLILQLAHRIGRDQTENLGHPVSVYAETRATLNGRRARPLIDPTVDLMQVKDGLGRASWILPPPTDAPPRIRPVL